MSGLFSPWGLAPVGLFPVAAADGLFLEIQSSRVALLQDGEMLGPARREARGRLGLAEGQKIDILGLAAEHSGRGRELLEGLPFPQSSHRDVYGTLEAARDKDVPFPCYSPPDGLLPLWHRWRGSRHADRIMGQKNPAAWGEVARKAARSFSEAGAFQRAGDIFMVAGAHVRLFGPEEAGRALSLFREAARCYLDGSLHAHAAYAFFIAGDFAHAALEASFPAVISPEVLWTLASWGMEKDPDESDPAAFAGLLAVLQTAYAHHLLARGALILARLHFTDAAANALAGDRPEMARRVHRQGKTTANEDTDRLLRPLVLQATEGAG